MQAPGDPGGAARAGPRPAKMRIGAAEVAAAREAAERERSVDRRDEVDLGDAAGEACARVETVEHVRRRRPEDGPG